MARDPYRYFRVEARELVDQLGKGVLSLEKGGGGEVVSQLLRLAHTLKGAARVVKLAEIAENAHAIEGLLEPSRDGGTIGTDTINELLQRLDAIGDKVTGLTAPEPQAASPAPAAVASPASEPELLIRAEVEQIDTLLEGVAEASARLSGLRSVLEQSVRAGQLAELLAQQLGARAVRADGPAPGRSDRALALAEELRLIIGGLERATGPACDRIGRELRQIRDGADQLRLVPAGTLFTPLERTARDAALALGKRIAFTASGGEVRLDGKVLRRVQEALTQVVRNAVAHGVEAQADREAAGKAADGRVALSVIRRGRRVVFRCEDDGRGIDLENVRRTALRKGVPVAELDRLDAGGVARLILRGGLSTSDTLTEISGRGIGMDIVNEAVERLGGEIVIRTEPGRGTTMDVVVPLSLASVEALTVEAGGIAAAIPLDAIQSTRRLADGEVSRTADGETIVFDGKMVPFAALARLMRREAARRPSTGRGSSAVVVRGSAGLAAIGVDRLVGTGEVVLRTLPELAPADAIVAGASLDMDGRPQLVLDADGLVEAALRRAGEHRAPPAPARPVLVVDDSLTTRMLEQSILESAGYLVDVAASAEEGLERARQKTYALFLVDVEMPGMDGFGFIERIRADAALKDIPAILVTSLNSPEAMRRGEQAGAQGYMIKSEFDQSRLLALIRRLTEHQHG